MPDSRPRRRVALFCDVYPPGYRAGGPPVSLERLVEREAGTDIRVITRDRDVLAPTPFPGIRPREWTSRGPAQVAYLRPGFMDWPWLIRQLREWGPDLIYLNSLYSPWFSMLPLSLRRAKILNQAPVLLAPRGECSTAAQTTKATKKVLAKPAIRCLIPANLVWHASSTLEEVDIRTWRGGRQPLSHSVVILPNPAPPPANSPSFPRESPDFRIVFASRIHPIKGLRDLLIALQEVDISVELCIHGHVQDAAYWKECTALIEVLPRNISARVHGEFAPGELQRIASNADLFILPTRGESFGQAIAEAMSVGCPVVIPRTTPWTLVAERGGYLVDSPDGIRDAIKAHHSLSISATKAHRAVTHQAYLDWYSRAQDSGPLFDAALNRVEHTQGEP